MVEQERPVKFTAKDIWCEFYHTIISSGNPIDSFYLVVSGIRYNQAKDSRDSEKIARVYDELHESLREFKHNVIGRGLKHW